MQKAKLIKSNSIFVLLNRQTLFTLFCTGCRELQKFSWLCVFSYVCLCLCVCVCVWSCFMAGHESILWHLLPYCVCLCVWAIILLIYESSFKGLHTINYAYISSNGILQFTHIQRSQLDTLSMKLNGLITRLGSKREMKVTEFPIFLINLKFRGSFKDLICTN